MKKYILLLILSLISLSTYALEYRCPKSISSTQLLKSTPEGWSQMVDKVNGQQNFQNLTIYDGNPEEAAALVPDDLDPKKITAWTNHSLKGLWMACFYQQSTVRLIREIPKSVKKCTLTKDGMTLICQ